MKNKLSFLIPALIVVIGIATFAMSAATNLQTWQTTTGSKVANIDSNGSLNITGTGSVNFGTVYSTSTSGSVAAITNTGSITMSEPFAGTAYKKVIISTGGTTFTSSAAQTFTFPTAFTGTPVAVGNTITSGTGSALTLTNTSAVLSASGTGSTGNLIIEGN